MELFVIRLLIMAALLLVVARLVPGIELSGFGHALVASLVLGLVNVLVRPLLIFLTLPLTILTLGLFLLVINALMLRLVAALVSGFEVRGFMPALWGSLLLTIFSAGLSLMM